MKHTLSTKLLSLFLTIALLVSCCPFAAMAEEVPSEPEVIQAETEAPAEPSLPEETEAAEEEPEAPPVTEATEAAEVTEPAETTEATEATEPTAEAATEPAEVTLPTEETVPTEATEPTEETEETVPVELPEGLNGLPEDYELSREELAAKQEMADHDVAATAAELTAGEDYEQDVLIISADTREQAEIYAEAFNAQLEEYDYGIGKLRLNEASVVDAVAAAQDMEMPLPAAYPNYITRVSPIPSEGSHKSSVMSLNETPQRATWNTWVNQILTNPDPALVDPSEWYYQYMHDMVDSYAA